MKRRGRLKAFWRRYNKIFISLLFGTILAGLLTASFNFWAQHTLAKRNRRFILASHNIDTRAKTFFQANKFLQDKLHTLDQFTKAYYNLISKPMAVKKAWKVYDSNYNVKANTHATMLIASLYQYYNRCTAWRFTQLIDMYDMLHLMFSAQYSQCTKPCTPNQRAKINDQTATLFEMPKSPSGWRHIEDAPWLYRGCMLEQFSGDLLACIASSTHQLTIKFMRELISEHQRQQLQSQQPIDCRFICWNSDQACLLPFIPNDNKLLERLPASHGKREEDE